MRLGKWRNLHYAAFTPLKHLHSIEEVTTESNGSRGTRGRSLRVSVSHGTAAEPAGSAAGTQEDSPCTTHCSKHGQPRAITSYCARRSTGDSSRPCEAIGPVPGSAGW